MSERKTLTILEVKPAQSATNKKTGKPYQMLTFSANDKGATNKYVCFNPNLFSLVRQGETIDADVETSSHWHEGQEYQDRKVTQIYKDGQPMNVKQRYGKSPEEIQSIKAQVAAKAITEMFVADKLDLFIDSQNYLAIGLREWLKTALIQDNPLADVKPIPAETIHTESKDEPKVETLTQLKGLMSKHKVGTHEAYEILSINSFMELVDLDEAWEKIKEARNI